MSTPPYPAKTRLTGASITVLILAWLAWALLLLSYGIDLLIASFGHSPNQSSLPQPMNNDFTAVLVACSVFQILVIAFVRWLGLHFLITPRRLIPGTWSAAIVALLVTGLILVLIKSIEVYGLILWFGSMSWPHYLPFYGVSLLLLLAHLPAFCLLTAYYSVLCPHHQPVPPCQHRTDRAHSHLERPGRAQRPPTVPKGVTINQRQPLLDKNGVPRPIGTFRPNPSPGKS
ncbi:hypothetical protein [Verrucomicrobium spinosum]|uniref:hypothetical protein n=1 Tax=Verrucomicrobium spinosum TaxID=2736 RepID=UPI0009467EDD|nr:hypothetical protein [Verrucomicrobium spinosum]